MLTYVRSLTAASDHLLTPVTSIPQGAVTAYASILPHSTRALIETGINLTRGERVLTEGSSSCRWTHTGEVVAIVYACGALWAGVGEALLQEHFTIWA